MKHNKKGYLARLIIAMFALLLTAAITPGIYISGIWAGFWAALILGLVNIVVKPILTILTLPITILTMGLFLLVINGITLLITAGLISGFYVSGIFAAILGSIIMSLFTWLINKAVD